MISTHLSDDGCLDYLTGDLSIEERASIGAHLERCPQCLSRLEQYRELFDAGLPSMSAEIASQMEVLPLPWSIEEGEDRLVGAARADARNDSRVIRELDSEESLPLESVEKPQAGRRVFLSRNGSLGLAAAASVVLLLGLMGSVYRLGVKRGAEQIQASRVPRTEDEGIRAQLEKLSRERDELQAGSLERVAAVSQLKAQIDQQRKLNQLMEEKLESANQEAGEQVQLLSSQRDEFARKLEDQKTLLAVAQKKLDGIQQSKSNESLRIVSLENQIQQLTALVKDKDATIDQRERLLASDRDIRELMGARDLYIAEVYDVGGNGKTKKPYGRVFYTKGKSLIFYGYDLDQQPGLRTANAFQAWGLRGPDRTKALNLGIMYVDNSANKRWVLRFDDPNILKEINAVFVTVEPDGESRVPRGKQVLFAYLKEEPNHP
jgi:anti-sigma factor RsiW